MQQCSNEKKDVNFLRVERIEELMKELGYEQGRKKEGINNQKDFAIDIGMEPQNFSRSMRSLKITEKFCQKIVDRFPQYRLDWLMGYSDLKTWDDWTDHNEFINDEILNGMWGLFEKCLVAKGKTLKFNHPADLKVDLSERDLYGCYYSIQDDKGNEIKKLSPQEMKKLEQKLLEYCDLLTMKYL